ncbi:MAG TPA: methylmalonyl-CoA mutase, partial [Desulfotomaculum sp.]|nr:methylmalonyl-CoA mutase [Desulfotomaculum sp.]
ACIDQNYLQQEIADAAYRYQQAVDSKKFIVVGVNEFINQNEKPEIEILKIDPGIEKEKIARLQKLRRDRNNLMARETLDNLCQACQGTENLMPYVLECVRAYATEGEIIQVMKEVFSEYREKPVF